MNKEMGKITILLSKEADRILRDNAKKNFRSISKEVEYLVLTYEKQK